MRIGAVAAAANVNEQTLRYYERAGLLPPPKRSANGYRDYPDDTVTLVRFIKRAQELGFSLEEARTLAGLRGDPASSCLQVRQLAANKLADIERRVADLSAMANELRALVTTCRESAAPACPILEALDHGHPDAVPAQA
jgi:Cu(I)-responsive transcriptional regulator